MQISKKALAALAARKMTKTELAHSLGVSPTYLSRNTPKLPPGPIRAKRQAAQRLFETRKAYRLQLANRVFKGRLSLDAAAKEAHCSIRTIYRYVCKLKK